MDISDVAIFCIGASAQQQRVFARASAMEGILFFSVPPDHLEGADAMLARLFLDRIAPADYSQLLYIDGDTQIMGTLKPLLQAQVPAGQFYAASDPMTFSMRSAPQNGHKLMGYFDALGLNTKSQHSYFNSGVLRINRSGWDEIGSESWALFQKLRGRSRYPDQDALNLVATDRHIPMSLVWNFPIFLRNARLEHAITPHIIHYMGNPKPWHGQFLPWGLAEYQTYLETARKYPALTPFIPQMSKPRKLKYLLQQRYKRMLEMATWGNGNRHREILYYESVTKHRLALSADAIP